MWLQKMHQCANKLKYPTYPTNGDKMYYALFTPSNNPINQPSHQYNRLGYLTQKELCEMNGAIFGSLCSIQEFESKEDFEAFLKQKDDEFYSEN